MMYFIKVILPINHLRIYKYYFKVNNFLNINLHIWNLILMDMVKYMIIDIILEMMDIDKDKYLDMMKLLFLYYFEYRNILH